MRIIDLPSDRGFVHFARLTKTVPELPEFVKEASIEDCAEDDQERPAGSYADTISKKFPIHTKAAAYLSYLYFKDQEGKYTKEAQARIRSRFKSAAELWGIKTELAHADKSLTAQEKTAGADECALRVQDKSFFPLNEPGEVIRSAGELVESRGNFPYSMRKEAATNIMKAAKKHGIQTADLPEEIHCMAGFGLCDKQASINEIKRRVSFAKGAHSPLADTYAKLAEEVSGASKLDTEAMSKVAEVVDTADRELKIPDEYGKAFPFPEDVFFGAFTEKKAQHIKKSTVEMITGTTYTLDQLSKSADALRVFGDDFYKDVVRGDGSVDLGEVADVLPTMPRDSAALFDRAMSSI